MSKTEPSETSAVDEDDVRPDVPGARGTLGRLAKRQPTAGDMVRSLVVLLIPILLITAFWSRDPEQLPGTEAVPWQDVHAQAVEEASFEVLAPSQLPGEWTPVRVAWEPGDDGAAERWMVGWLSPQQIYFEVEQSTAPVRPFLARATRDGAVDGASTLAGTTWQRYRSPDDRTRALVLTGDGVTTVVSADASYESLEAFAGTLG